MLRVVRPSLLLLDDDVDKLYLTVFLLVISRLFSLAFKIVWRALADFSLFQCRRLLDSLTVLGSRGNHHDIPRYTENHYHAPIVILVMLCYIYGAGGVRFPENVETNKWWLFQMVIWGVSMYISLGSNDELWYQTISVRV